MGTLLPSKYTKIVFPETDCVLAVVSYARNNVYIGIGKGTRG